MTNMTPSKSWYKRRRYWLLAILAALIYFCLIPSPLRISPETTGFTSPLLPNGDVDYFGAFENLYLHKLSPPEDNGLRLLIANCGPRILEQQPLMDAVPWEELPTHEIAQQWFEKYWLPLCHHMDINPYAKPQFLDSLDFVSFLEKQRKEREKTATPAGGAQFYFREFVEEFVAVPWTAEEHPDIAQWLEERSPVLDLFGIAVRKPNFACYRWREDDLLAILLPDVQASRTLARDLRVRIAERLGREDVDGAWHDVMSLFFLNRKHYIRDPHIVVNMVGIHIEGMGIEAVLRVLQHGNPSPEQLERFADDLAKLPRKTILDTAAWEEKLVYAFLQKHPETKIYAIGQDGLTHFSHEISVFYRFLSRWLPSDRNIAGKRVAELNNIERLPSGNSAENIDWTVMQKHFEARNHFFDEMDRQLVSPWSLLRIPLIRTRSQLLAYDVIRTYYPATEAGQAALFRSNARFDMLCIAMALERYKAANGGYPDDLELLVPHFLDAVPIDIFTGRKTLAYRLAPGAAAAYMLYSYGPNGIDDGGVVLERLKN
ncbi:MAG: type II secretion system protein GspG [Planctomycetaceae bacterium]|nr:type II secretion system protein GspG [Planctomycetaceae bacterium]